MNLSTKCAYNPSSTDMLAKLSNKILLHDQQALVFEAQYLPWGRVSHPTVAMALFPDSNSGTNLSSMPKFRNRIDNVCW